MAVTLNLQIGANYDDVSETYGGSIIPTGSAIPMGNYSSYRHAGYRFTSVSGLSGSTIINAELQFYANTTDSGAFGGDLYAHDVEAPGTFTLDYYNVTGRTRTTATVPAGWLDFGSWTAGNWYSYPTDGTIDIKSIIQELADSYDPSAIAILFIYSVGTGERLAESYDDDTPKAAKLDITYTAAGGDATLTAVVTTATALSPVSVWTADATLSAVVTTALAESPAAEITGTEAGTLVAAVATATALSPVSVWTADATLSAVVATAYAISPAATIFAGAVDWTAFDETQFQVIRSDLPTGALFYLEVVMTTSTAQNTVKARLYNVTDSTRVTGSEVSSTCTSPAPALSGAFGLPDGTKTYRLEGGGDTGGSYKWRVAKVLVDW